jgi:hypothetical protein
MVFPHFPRVCFSKAENPVHIFSHGKTNDIHPAIFIRQQSGQPLFAIVKPFIRPYQSRFPVKKDDILKREPAFRKRPGILQGS